MERVQDFTEFERQLGVLTQYMVGYTEGDYTLQVFVASEYCWFYVIVYDENDILIGVFTVMMDNDTTLYRIKYAADFNLIEDLTDKFIKLKREEYDKHYT